MKNCNMEIGAAIALIRKEKGIKSYVVAEEVGITHAYLSLIENKKRIPTLGTLEKIAKALTVPVSRLVREAEQLDKGKHLSLEFKNK